MPSGVIPEEKRCKGITRTGERCKRAPAPGREYCRLHGGARPVGPANGNWKGGKYSKFFPAKLRGRYQAFQNDPDALNNRQEMAALETRIAALIEVADEDVSIKTWRKMYDLWQKFMFAVRSGDQVKQIELVTEIDEFIASRNADDNLWRDIQSLTETRRKLADSEHRRAQAMNQMLTVEQVMTLLAALIASIKEVVYDYADPVAAAHIIEGTSDAYTKLISVEESGRHGTGTLAK